MTPVRWYAVTLEPIITVVVVQHNDSKLILMIMVAPETHDLAPFGLARLGRTDVELLGLVSRSFNPPPSASPRPLRWEFRLGSITQ